MDWNTSVADEAFGIVYQISAEHKDVCFAAYLFIISSVVYLIIDFAWMIRDKKKAEGEKERQREIDI